jgi:hypothetical protein
MATKKTSTAAVKQDKQYLVMDNDGDPIAYGTMDEIKDTLNEYNDEADEYDELSFPEWIAQCTIYELGIGKKLKFTPAAYEIK